MLALTHNQFPTQMHRRLYDVGVADEAEQDFIDERLAQWLDDASDDLLFLEVYEEDGFELDYSGESLARVGEIVADRAGGDGYLARGAAGYVGETLLRLAGGHWGWTDGKPTIHADTALGLPPLSPVELVARTVVKWDRDLFSRTYATWEQAVARHRAVYPTWTPTKQHTPGFDPTPPSSADAENLRAWQAYREQAFPAWVQEHSADGPWDFTADSLDRLEALVIRRIPTPDALDDPGTKDFVDAAAWYLGEVLLRARGSGGWMFRSQDPAGPPDMFAGRPFLDSGTSRTSSTIPEIAITNLVGNYRRPLRRWYEEWSR